MGSRAARSGRAVLERPLELGVHLVRGDGHESGSLPERQAGRVVPQHAEPDRNSGAVGTREHFFHDRRADPGAPVRRKQAQIDDATAAGGPRDPQTADRIAVEQDQLVLRFRKPSRPVLTLRAELQIEERVADIRRPVRDLGARRCVELAQKGLVRVGDRPPRDR